tara:strand:- start:110 stop:1033 length:924 start_codon:yes stop_codon:yes gene_type:complete
MATHVITRRAYNIMLFIFSKKYPSKKDILEYLKEYKDFDISIRTLERDFERIESDFGIEIKYDKLRNGYKIDEEKSDKVDSFIRFLEIVTVTNIFSDSLKNNDKLLEYISFDDSKSFKGIENLKKIFLAISQERKLIFNHHSYQKPGLKKYEIIPLKLKEYENRWYVLGVQCNQSDVWSFGIDRMTELKLGMLNLEKRSFYKDKLEKYKDILGVSFELEDPKEKVKIELLIDEEHTKYLSSLPLHHSQKIDSKTENNKQRVRYELIPNYEFKIQILKMGNKAELISPIELRNDIKRMLEDTLNNYVK